MLEARLLTKNYGQVRAVRKASFTIRPGEILGFLGANGAGKTTTIKMLTGLIEPSEGQILYSGHSIYQDLAAYQRRLGYVPEEAYLYPHLSGREYLQLVGRLRGIPRNVLDPKLDELLEIFGLWDDRFAALSSYSKGMRQKILLAAALIHNPDVLILDEPFSGLDVTSALMLRRLLAGLAERGKIVLYSSHVLEVVEKVCSKVLILRQGEVVAYDSIDVLREMMRQPSLEGVFAQLVDAQGQESSADRILQVITSDQTHQPGPKRSREMSLVPLGTSVARSTNNVRGVGESAIRTASKYLADLAQDLRRSVRTLAASPGFTAVALLSLSMGICIAACAFSEMNGMVLRNVPVVSKPDELVALEWPATYPEYKRYRERKEVFASTAAYIAPVPFTVSFGGHKERTWGHLVSSSYFSTLGAPPTLGRLFGAPEEKSGGAPEVVVSYRFWEEQLGRDSAIVGKTLQVNGNACTVIGVGPKDFLGASPALYIADLWIPVTVGSKLAPELENDALERNDLALFHVVGRLEPGVSIERAEAELDVVARQLELEHNVPSNLDKSRRITLAEGGRLLPLRKQDLPFFTSFFFIMAGLVMLIACANVANWWLHAVPSGEGKLQFGLPSAPVEAVW